MDLLKEFRFLVEDLSIDVLLSTDMLSIDGCGLFIDEIISTDTDFVCEHSS